MHEDTVVALTVVIFAWAVLSRWLADLYLTGPLVLTVAGFLLAKTVLSTCFAYVLRRFIDGMSDACRALGLPQPAQRAGAALPVAALRELLLELSSSGVVLPDVERFGVERSGGGRD